MVAGGLGGMRVRRIVLALCMAMAAVGACASDAGDAGVVCSVEGTWAMLCPDGHTAAVKRLSVVQKGARLAPAAETTGVVHLALYDGRQIAIRAGEAAQQGPITLAGDSGLPERLRESMARIFLGQRPRLVPTLSRGGTGQEPAEWILLGERGRGLDGLADLKTLQADEVQVTVIPVDPRGESAGHAMEVDWTRQPSPAAAAAFPASGVYRVLFPDEAPWFGREAWVLMEDPDRLKGAAQHWEIMRGYAAELAGGDEGENRGLLRAALVALYLSSP